VRRDLQRYFELNSRDGSPSFVEKLGIVLNSPGLHAVLVYRFGSWVNRNLRFWLLRYAFKIVHFVLDKLVIILWGIHIDKGAKIGGGLYVGHFSGVLIGPIKMGSDCNISHGVTIGRRAGGDAEVPTIGDRVWIGVGSVVFGGIHIGDGTTIGPLSVVARNLPSQVLVVGNPIRLLRINYNNSVEIYGENRHKDGASENLRKR
jgi:serine O-acetyltransferase